MFTITDVCRFCIVYIAFYGVVASGIAGKAFEEIVGNRKNRI